MRSTQTWLLLVVSLALAGGLAAFLLATPDEGRRPSGDELGFAQLNEQDVLADLQHAEQYHRTKVREAKVLASAKRNASAWLRSVAGSGETPKSMPNAVSITPGVRPFVRWADDLPRDRWTATIAKVEPDLVPGVEAVESTYVATGSVDVVLANATNRTRRQRVPITMRLEPAPTPAGGVPKSWTLSDVTVRSPRILLRAYADPIVLHRATVDVVAPVADRELATRLSNDAATQLPALVQRWSAIAGAGVTTIWVIENTGRTRAVLGHEPPVATISAGIHDDHAATWIDRGGDVVVDASRMQRLAPDEQLAALRHVLAHVATRRLDAVAPALFVEGIASFESHRFASPADPLAGIDLSPLIGAFDHADSGLAGLLVADAGMPLDTGSSSTEQLASLAAIAWIEDIHGHADLVRIATQLARHVEPARAIADVLDLDARGVEVAVARWTRDQDDRADTTLRGDEDDSVDGTTEGIDT